MSMRLKIGFTDLLGLTDVQGNDITVQQNRGSRHLHTVTMISAANLLFNPADIPNRAKTIKERIDEIHGIASQTAVTDSHIRSVIYSANSKVPDNKIASNIVRESELNSAIAEFKNEQQIRDLITSNSVQASDLANFLTANEISNAIGNAVNPFLTRNDIIQLINDDEVAFGNNEVDARIVHWLNDPTNRNVLNVILAAAPFNFRSGDTISQQISDAIGGLSQVYLTEDDINTLITNAIGSTTYELPADVVRAAQTARANQLLFNMLAVEDGYTFDVSTLTANILRELVAMAGRVVLDANGIPRFTNKIIGVEIADDVVLGSHIAADQLTLKHISGYQGSNNNGSIPIITGVSVSGNTLRIVNASGNDYTTELPSSGSTTTVNPATAGETANIWGDNYVSGDLAAVANFNSDTAGHTLTIGDDNGDELLVQFRNSQGHIRELHLERISTDITTSWSEHDDEAPAVNFRIRRIGGGDQFRFQHTSNAGYVLHSIRRSRIDTNVVHQDDIAGFKNIPNADEDSLLVGDGTNWVAGSPSQVREVLNVPTNEAINRYPEAQPLFDDSTETYVTQSDTLNTASNGVFFFSVSTTSVLGLPQGTYLLHAHNRVIPSQTEGVSPVEIDLIQRVETLTGDSRKWERRQIQGRWTDADVFIEVVSNSGEGGGGGGGTTALPDLVIGSIDDTTLALPANYTDYDVIDVVVLEDSQRFTKTISTASFNDANNGDYWQTGNTGSDYFRKSNDRDITVPNGHTIVSATLRDFGGGGSVTSGSNPNQIRRVDGFASVLNEIESETVAFLVSIPVLGLPNGEYILEAFEDTGTGNDTAQRATNFTTNEVFIRHNTSGEWSNADTFIPQTITTAGTGSSFTALNGTASVIDNAESGLYEFTIPNGEDVLGLSAGTYRMRATTQANGSPANQEVIEVSTRARYTRILVGAGGWGGTPFTRDNRDAYLAPISGTVVATASGLNNADIGVFTITVPSGQNILGLPAGLYCIRGYRQIGLGDIVQEAVSLNADVPVRYTRRRQGGSWINSDIFVVDVPSWSENLLDGSAGRTAISSSVFGNDRRTLPEMEGAQVVRVEAAQVTNISITGRVSDVITFRASNSFAYRIYNGVVDVSFSFPTSTQIRAYNLGDNDQIIGVYVYK